MSSSSHVLLCTLGPVQDFIHTARRCQDLWFGSWLLSHLSLKASEAILEFVAEDAIVFPGSLATTDGPGAGIANRVLAVLPAGVDPQAVADAANQAQTDALADIAQMIVPHDPAVDRPTALAQIMELMEWNWVAAPFGAGEGDYAQARQTAEKWMSANKAGKRWSQPSWKPTAGLPKSSLDGARESVLDERIYDDESRLYRKPELRRQVFGTKGAERLCGVGLVKRLGANVEGEWFSGHAPRFHSTSHVAMGPTMARLRGRDAEVGRYLGKLEQLGVQLSRHKVNHRIGLPCQGSRYDGVLLLDSRLDEHLEAVTDANKRRTAVGEARDALRQLLSREPCPYYAFVIADGDRMGKAIDALTSVRAHRALSDALNAFASDCAGIVDKFDGSLIFAGGDDVVALLPLHTALACSRALAVSFSACMAQGLRGHEGALTERAPTLSVGLGIAHCREDMAEARRLAQRAEQLAKGPRNALAVIVSKRSGADLEVVGSWDDPNPLDARLRDWSGWLERGLLSRKASHDLDAVVTHYAGADLSGRAAEVTAYYRYVCKAKRIAGGGESADPDVIDKLDLAVVGGAHSPDDPEQILKRLHDVVQEIQVADLFARALADAAVPLEAPELVGGAA